MKIAICEDNRDDSGIICGYLQRYFDTQGYVGDICCFESGEEILHSFSPGVFDVVFMDIYMDGISGIETAQKMRKQDSGFALVYITASEEHARQAYTLQACAYVSKPVKSKEMEMALVQCQRVFLKNARYIEVISERKTLKLPFVKILYIEVYNKEVLFHTADGIITATATLTEVEQQCGGEFLRCHRSYIVNMNHIDRICKEDIRMKNGQTVPMRQRERQKLRDAYGNFLTNRLFDQN